MTSRLRCFRSALRNPYTLAIAFAVVTGLVLRVWHVSEVLYSPVTDMLAYLKERGLIFAGEKPYYWQLTIMFSPGYPFFLHLVGLISNGLATLKPLGYVQAFTDAGTIAMIAYIARYLYGARTAIVAAWLYAFYLLSIGHVPLALTESMALTTWVAATVLFLHFLRRDRWWWALAFGVMVAISGYIRTNQFTILGPMALYGSWHFWRRRRSDKKWKWGVARLAIGLIVPLLLMVPWSVRNSRLVQRPMLLSDDGANALLLGNNPVADGAYADFGRLSARERQAVHTDVNINYSAEQVRYALNFIRNTPAYQVFYLVPNRFLKLFVEDQAFWPWDDNLPTGNYLSYPFGPRVYIPTVPYLVVLVLGGVGLFLRNRRVPWFMLAMLFFLIGPYLLLKGELRHRFVSDPCLIIPAAFVLQRCAPRGKRFVHALVRVAVVFAAVALIGTLVNWARFSGPNLLTTRRTKLLSDATRQMMSREGFVWTGATNEKGPPAEIRLAEVEVDPGIEPHLEVAFNVAIRNCKSMIGILQYKLEYLDQQGQPVTFPPIRTDLLAGQHRLNQKIEGGDRVWRVIRLPAAARRIRLRAWCNYSADIRISSLSVRGPVWSCR